MEKKTTRPVLLTGLIMAIVSLSFALLSEIYGMVFVIQLLSASGAGEYIYVYIFSFILTLAIIISGIVTASISIKYFNVSPKKFARRKNLISAPYSMCLTLAILEIIGMVELQVVDASVIVLIINIMFLVASAILIITDILRNTKLLEQEVEEEQKLALENQQKLIEKQVKDRVAEIQSSKPTVDQKTAEKEKIEKQMKELEEKMKKLQEPEDSSEE